MVYTKYSIYISTFVARYAQIRLLILAYSKYINTVYTYISIYSKYGYSDANSLHAEREARSVQRIRLPLHQLATPSGLIILI